MSQGTKKRKWMEMISTVQNSIQRFFWPKQALRQQQLVQEAQEVLDEIIQETAQPQTKREEKRKANQAK